MIKELFKVFIDEEELIKSIKASSGAELKKNNLLANKRDIENKIKQVFKMKSELYIDFSEDILNEDEYIEINNRYSENITDYEKQLVDIHNSIESLETTALDDERIRTLVHKYTHRRKLSIRFISVNDGYDSDDYKGTTSGMNYALKSLMNQLYSVDLSKKVSSSLNAIKREGKYVHSSTPYGYSFDPTDKHKLVIDSQFADVIRFIFQKASEGLSAGQIAKQLNEKGIPSDRKKGTVKWDSSLVLRKIRNETYIGNLVQSKSENVGFGDNKKNKKHSREEQIIVENAVEPIVSKELFEKANTNFPEKHINRPKTFKKHLFKCPYCGRNLKLSAKRYICRNKYNSADARCQTLFIKAETAENYVMETIRETCKLALDRYEIIRSKEETDKDSIKDTIKLLTAEKEKLKALPVRLYMQYSEGNISKEDFIAKKQQTNERLAETENKLSELNIRLEENNGDTIHKQNIFDCSKLKEYDGTALSKIIKEVLVYSENKIEIIFNCNDFIKGCIKE